LARNKLDYLKVEVPGKAFYFLDSSKYVEINVPGFGRVFELLPQKKSFFASLCILFNFIKEKLSMSLRALLNFFKGKKPQIKKGVIAVSNEGDALVVTNFAPQSVKVNFTEPSPMDSCHHHCPTDHIDVNLCQIGFSRWQVKISWSVREVRHIEYEIAG